MNRLGFQALLLLVALALAGCQTSNAKTNAMATFQWTSPTKKVVLVQPDVQLSELDVGGIREPRADWTEAAQGFISKGLRSHFGKSGVDVVDATDPSAHEIQLGKLHNMVGYAIIKHLYIAGLQLPNKGTALEWTIGPGANEMRDHYGADYAIFVFIRDSYSSAGRQALQILDLTTNSVQARFASLVDLRTGNIVWFNLMANQSGDLRTEAPAQRTVDELIKGIPI